MSFIKAFFRFVWGAIKAFHIIGASILLVFLLAILASGFSGKKPPVVRAGSALVLAPKGDIVELARLPNPFEQLDVPGAPNPPPETSVHDLVKALRRAADDERITTLFVQPDDISSAGPATLHYLGAEIERFKQSGKRVIAYSDSFSQGGYLLAAHADEIYLNPMGSMDLVGYGSFPIYFAGALEKLKARVEVFKVGTYKSAVEPFIRNDMSPEAKEANRAFLGTLWNQYTSKVETARGLAAGTIDGLLSNLVEIYRAGNGDDAQIALEQGFVDALKTRAQMQDYMVETVGRQDKGFRGISVDTYLAATNGDDANGNNQIAIIFARGQIVPGGNDDVSVTAADVVAGTIRQARNNDKTKAIVLRVDSPGGSAFASEIIRQELLAAKADGIPVVASYGSVAASGGYWISASADEIISEPTTITGSIGIFGVFPTFEQGLAEIGISSDGVGTSDLAGAFSPTRGLTDKARALAQVDIEAGYDQFLTIVAEGRGMTKEAVDQVAQGRVWAGQTALDLGLVDQLGTIDDAIAAAADRAGLSDYNEMFYRPKPDPFDQLLADIMRNAQVVGLVPEGTRSPLPSFLERDLRRIAQQVDQFFDHADPKGRYLVCTVCMVR